MYIIYLQVLPHFPKIIGVGQALERRVDRVYKEEKEKRPDLYALAMGYSGLLKGRKSHWLTEQDFHYVNPVSVVSFLYIYTYIIYLSISYISILYNTLNNIIVYI